MIEWGIKLFAIIHLTQYIGALMVLGSLIAFIFMVRKQRKSETTFRKVKDGFNMGFIGIILLVGLLIMFGLVNPKDESEKKDTPSSSPSFSHPIDNESNGASLPFEIPGPIEVRRSFNLTSYEENFHV